MDPTVNYPEPFILMDNGIRFYLHVIGLSPLSQHPLPNDKKPETQN